MSRTTHETDYERAGSHPAGQVILQRADLLAVVGHDLRQPLSAAIMAMEFAADLLDQGSEVELVRTHIALAERCMRQTLLLADDLLAIGVAEAGALRLHPSPVDVVSLLDETRALITLHARARHVEILTVTPGAVPCPMADHNRLLQVLANVCGNAVKFTPAGGRVILAAAERDDGIELSVTDSGPGVSAEDLPHVFDPYWRASGGASGTGLGLYIAKWLVEAHGGRIRACAARAGGLTVAITIPLGSAELASEGQSNGGLAK